MRCFINIGAKGKDEPARPARAGQVRLFVLLALGVLFAGREAGAIIPATPILLPTQTVQQAAAVIPTTAKPSPLVWQEDLETALLDAAAQYRSVLILFTSPDCIYCRRLKTSVLSDPEVQNLLRQFTLLEEDVGLHPDLELQFRLQGVPTMVVLSSDGQERGRIVGMVRREDLTRILQSALGQAGTASSGPAEAEAKTILAQETISNEQWVALMPALANAELREEVRQRLRTLTPFPREALVRLLSHEKLAVRLGALEWLEEAAGDDFGYDPWETDSASPTLMGALNAWQKWAAGGKTDTNRFFATLTREQVLSYLGDLVSEKRDRYLRAMRMLEQAGPSVLPTLKEYENAHTDLAPTARRRLQEVVCALLIPPVGGLKPETVAHRLVAGNLDAQIEALHDLGRIGPPALPALKNFLADDNALVREASLEAVGASGEVAMPVLLERAGQEEDPDVIVVLLRVVGQMGDPEGVTIIRNYLKHANEDVVISALQSLAKLENRGLGAELKSCLQDPRWRVRAAAAETVGTLKLRELAPDLEKRLEDEEPFVCYRAVQALAGVQGKSAADKLSELFIKEDSLKAPIINAFGELELNIPKSFGTALKGKEPGLLLAVLQELDECKDHGLPLAAQLAEHADTDVACTAIRLLGKYGMSKPEYQEQIRRILREGSRDRKLAALRSVKMEVQESYSSYGWNNWDLALAMIPPTATGVTSTVVDDLAAAFSNEGPGTTNTGPTATPEKPIPKAAPLADLFEAFEDGGTPSATTSGVASAEAAGSWIAEVRTFLTQDDEELRSAAALALLRLQQTDSVAYLTDKLADVSLNDRRQMAENLRGLKKPEVLKLLEQLIRDTSADVRKQAAEAIEKNLSDSAWADALFGELLRDKTPLHPDEIFDWMLINQVRQPASQVHVNRWIPELLKEDRPSSLRQLGLFLLVYAGRSTDVPLIASDIHAEDPWTRRAALQALMSMDPKKFAEQFPRMAKDPSEHVRILIPLAVSKLHDQQYFYFDEIHFAEASVNLRSGSDYFIWMDAAVRSNALALTQQLTRDPSPKVRLEAFMALMSRFQTIDVQALVATLGTFPDQRAVGERVGKFLGDNYKRLGREYSILLPYLRYSRLSSQIRRQVEKEMAKKQALTPGNEPQPMALRETIPTFVSEAISTNAPWMAFTSFPVRLVYFEERGCDECAEFSKLLVVMHQTFPSLVVETNDIATRSAQLLYAAISRDFQLPAEYRLQTPVVFGGAGYLIRDDLTFNRLAELIVRSRDIPLSAWYHPPQEEVAQPSPAEIKPVSAPHRSRTWWIAAAGGALLMMIFWKLRRKR